MDNQTRILWQVRAPHFTAGLVSYQNVVVEAAPIVKWAIGMNMNEVNRWFRYRVKATVDMIGMEKS